MADPSAKTHKRIREEDYTITFRRGALAKLKDLAWELEIPEERLSEVLEKGIKVLDLSRDGKLYLEKYGVKFEIDLKKI